MDAVPNGRFKGRFGGRAYTSTITFMFGIHQTITFRNGDRQRFEEKHTGRRDED